MVIYKSCVYLINTQTFIIIYLSLTMILAYLVASR